VDALLKNKLTELHSCHSTSVKNYELIDFVPRLMDDVCVFVVSAHSRSEQNAVFLLNRQNQFKQAAMSAKASGNIELAKKYLRMAKVIIIAFTFIASQSVK